MIPCALHVGVVLWYLYRYIRMPTYILYILDVRSFPESDLLNGNPTYSVLRAFTVQSDSYKSMISDSLVPMTEGVQYRYNLLDPVS